LPIWISTPHTHSSAFRLVLAIDYASRLPMPIDSRFRARPLRISRCGCVSYGMIQVRTLICGQLYQGDKPSTFPRSRSHAVPGVYPTQTTVHVGHIPIIASTCSPILQPLFPPSLLFSVHKPDSRFFFHVHVTLVTPRFPSSFRLDLQLVALHDPPEFLSSSRPVGIHPTIILPPPLFFFLSLVMNLDIPAVAYRASPSVICSSSVVVNHHHHPSSLLYPIPFRYPPLAHSISYSTSSLITGGPYTYSYPAHRTQPPLSLP